MIGHYQVPAYGLHNVYNALSVIAIAHLEGLDDREVAVRAINIWWGKTSFFREKSDRYDYRG